MAVLGDPPEISVIERRALNGRPRHTGVLSSALRLRDDREPCPAAPSFIRAYLWYLVRTCCETCQVGMCFTHVGEIEDAGVQFEPSPAGEVKLAWELGVRCVLFCW